LWLSALLGEPWPLIVSTLRSVGLSVHALAAAIAFRIASTSLLLSCTVSTCKS